LRKIPKVKGKKVSGDGARKKARASHNRTPRKVSQVKRVSREGKGKQFPTMTSRGRQMKENNFPGRKKGVTKREENLLWGETYLIR